MQNTLGLEKISLPAPGDISNYSEMEGASEIMYLSHTLMQTKCSFLYIAPNNQKADETYKEFLFFLKDYNCDILYLRDSETLPYDTESSPANMISDRSSVLSQLTNSDSGKPTVLVVTSSTFASRISSKGFWKSAAITLLPHQKKTPEEVKNELNSIHYTQTYEVRELGQYALKGDILDVWPFGSTSAARIRFTESVITSISNLNTRTQSSYSSIDSLSCLPSIQAPYNETISKQLRRRWNETFEGEIKHPVYRAARDGEIPPEIENYLPMFGETCSIVELSPKSLVVCNDEAKLAIDNFINFVNERYEEVSLLANRMPLKPKELWLTKEEVIEVFQSRGLLRSQSENNLGETFNAECSATNFERQPSVESTIEMLRPWTSGVSRIIFCLNSQARREEMDLICQMLETSHPTWIENWNQFNETQTNCALALGSVERGFYSPDSDFIFITEREVFGQPIFQSSLDENETVIETNKYSDFSTIKKGDPLVHIGLGIGRFEELSVMELSGMKEEFLVISYANDSKTFVKMSDLHLVSRYSGIDQENAPLHEMRNDKWLRGLTNSFKSIKKTAEDLTTIHNEKSVQVGVSINDPDHKYEKFCTEFPFQETSDQIRAVEEIKEDLLSRHPMDRIVCGDVGFGKTEVAMRAAFLAASSKLQVAVMVPSTILAQQHYESFVERFKSTKTRITLLTRGAGKVKEKEVLIGLADGTIDIIIGTHKIIQSDIKYRRLGLMIVDEEHRFGVKEKNSLKKYRPDVNLLSMTATPIPRTLSMSMHGIRDLSVIATPPAKRLSIRTHTANLDKSIVKEAVSREVQREGQIFYVHNSVDTIEEKAEELRLEFPNIRIKVCHARMNDVQLEKIMASFYKHEFDMLVATTIIETGIDVPNANTILIEDADHFGLAQLHQLRGRVGRSKRQAYAYLFRSSLNLSDSGAIRLSVMEDSSSLGEGFAIANHDLEIRGAGEILGKEQSGQIQAIGFQLYMRLLEMAIAKLGRYEEFSSDLSELSPTELDLGLNHSIPSEYISNEATRLSFYKKVADIETEDELERFIENTSDRFGEIPNQMKQLANSSLLRAKASQIGIQKISVLNDSFELKVTNPETASKIKQQRKSLTVLNPEEGRYIDKLKTSEQKNIIKTLTKILTPIIS